MYERALGMARQSRSPHSRNRRSHTPLLTNLLTAAVESDPDRIAVRFDPSGDPAEQRQLTYQELDAVSSRLARELIGRGIGAGDVVVMGIRRGVESVVAVWAIAKAGAAFVPVDPTYPRERIAHMVADSGAVLGLTSTVHRSALGDAVEWIELDDPAQAARIAENPDHPISYLDRIRPIDPRHPAYIIYTSGSTGTPKGVVITHTGLGGLVASARETLRVSRNSRVLHASSPSFDASVEELLVAFSSGATLVVAPPDIFGGPELADLLHRERVTHLSMTPGALASLDPDGLDDLEVVEVGGDRCGPELVARWAREGRLFINGYGPTEATVLATLSDPIPPEGPVTIGRAIAGVTAIVLDTRLRPAPAGSVGELYLSGPALAEGYLGRPGLTAERFVANPFGAEAGARETRLYRTGDLVRRNETDGTLEHLGRSDFQIKIRGFRIELGEIDTALTAHPGIGFAVTVGKTLPSGATALVSYVMPRQGVTLDIDELTTFVANRLPEYMVPASITVLDEIPLTPIGKVDRAALPEPAFATAEFRPPVTETESVIAEAFAAVLGVERVGIDDSFFALGGDSILSIQMAVRARKRGVVFTPRDVFDHRTVAALAEIATSASDPEQPRLDELPGGGVGTIPLTPIMAATLAKGSSWQRFSQSMALRLPAGIDRGTLVATLDAVITHHDVLRSRLRAADPADPGLVAEPHTASWTFEALGRGAVDVDALVHRVELPADIDDAELSQRASAAYDGALGRLDPANAVMLQFLWFAFTTPEPDSPTGRRDVLLVVAHHFVVDGVSWRILIPDLALAWSQLIAGRQVSLPANGTSMRRWAYALTETATEPARRAELEFWQQVSDADDPPLGSRALDPAIDTLATVDQVRVTVPAEVTNAVLTTIPSRYHGGVADALLSALALALSKWRRLDKGGSAVIKLEGHGREEQVVAGSDLSRTIGWFTSAFPVRLKLDEIDLDDAFAGGPALGAVVKSVKEQLLAVPDNGIGYGLLRYLDPDTAGRMPETGQIGFNYLGRVTAGEIPAELAELGWVPVDDLGELAAEMDSDMPANGVIDINAIVADGTAGPELTASFAFATKVISRDPVQEFAQLWTAALTAFSRHARRPDAGGRTPSDLPLVRVSQPDIEVWERDYPALADVWPLAPLQAGLLFHALLAGSDVDVYTTQSTVDLAGELETARLRTAAQAMLDRYPNLRTAFVTDSDGNAVQLVMSRSEAQWREVDLTGLPAGERRAELQRLIDADRRSHFDLTVAPLLRFTLYRTGAAIDAATEHTEDVAAQQQWCLVITSHHILLDGWSMPLLLRDLLLLYASRGDESGLPRVAPYRGYLNWLAGRDREASLQTWAKALTGLDEPSLLAPPSRPGERTRIDRLNTEIDAGRTRRITERAAALGVTVNTVLQVAWGLLLGRLTGRDDVVFGATVSGRPAELPGVESMVGLFINTLPVRVRIDERHTVGEFLQDVQRDQAALLDHHQVGLSDIQRIAGAAAQFDTLLVFESYPIDREAIAATSSIDGMSVTGVRLADDTHYPLTLVVTAGSTIEITWRYLNGRFTAGEVETMAARLVRVLDALSGDPVATVGDIDILLDEAEQNRILLQWNGSRHRVEPELLLDGYRRAVSAYPDRVAIAYAGSELTYREFDERVNRLARALISRGVGPESLVGLAIRRSPELVVGMYAVLTAGGAYVPVDPDHPAERIAYILHTAQPVCVLTTDSVPVPDGIAVLRIDSGDPDGFESTPVRAAELLRPARTDDLAYVLFTSGSTGRPKGVAITHRAVGNHLAWMLDRHPLGPDDAYLQKAPTTFDMSVWGYFMPLRVGAKLVLATPDGHRDPVYLAETIAVQRVTATDFVPSMLAEFAAQVDPAAVATLRHVINGGEVLTAETVAALHAICDARVHNLYGPTETAVSITSRTASGDERTDIPIGTPGWNCGVHVLDSRLRPVPARVPGELYLAGDQLARGYVRRAALTAERFVANPFDDGQRMYRTGDLVRWRTDGVLEYLGRTDFQVKFRGQRIELGEIESALAALPSVQQAVAAVLPSQLGDQLVGYVVPTPDDRHDTAETLAALARTLPAYMIPATIVKLAEFPRNTSGKVDRRMLPRPEFGLREFRAPSTPAEEIVAGVFAEVLGLDRVGTADDFFALGGNSLVATRAVARLSAALGTRVPVRALFDRPVVADLAAGIVPGGDDTAERPELRAVERGDFVPLSLAQLRMWVLNRIDPESPAYNIPFALHLRGSLNVPALAQAVQDVLERHEGLRTRYPADGPDGQPFQQILPVTEALPHGLQVEHSTVGVLDRIAELATTGFDVTAEAPVRIRLFRGHDTDEHVLVVVAHHICADGASMAPLARDLTTAYLARVAGDPPGWAPLAVQVADFAIWQHKAVGSENDPDSVAARQLAYWQRELAGISGVSLLPLDRPRPAHTSQRGASIAFTVPAAVHTRLAQIAQEHNSSLFMVVHATLAVLLARLSGGSDIAIGTPIAGRGAAVLDDLVGMFVNTLTLRTTVDRSAPFAALVDTVREVDLSGFAHADVPFERVVDAVLPARAGGAHPLFQVMLSFQNTEAPAFELPGLRISALDTGEVTAKFDLEVIVDPHHRDDGVRDELIVVFTYATDLFDEPTIQGLGRRFDRILTGVAADPQVLVGDIDVLDAGERDRALVAAGPEPAGPQRIELLPDLLAAAADRNPDGVAVIVDDSARELDRLDYLDLDEQSNRLARLLLDRGVGPGDLVVIGMPRSATSVLAIWAVAKTGAAIVPVDPASVADPSSHLPAEAALGLTVPGVDLPDALPWLTLDTDEFARQLADRSPAPIGDTDRPRLLRPDHPACVVRTSGASGPPRVVTVDHAALAGFCAELGERFRVTSGSRTLHFATPSSDAAMLELLLAVGGGATLVVAAPTVDHGKDLAVLLRRQRVSHAVLTAAELAAVDPAGLDRLRVVITDGAANAPDLVRRWEIPVAGGRVRELHHGYGSAAATT